MKQEEDIAPHSESKSSKKISFLLLFVEFIPVEGLQGSIHCEKNIFKKTLILAFGVNRAITHSGNCVHCSCTIFVFLGLHSEFEGFPKLLLFLKP